MKLESSGTF